MTLATTWSTANTAGIDFTAIWSALANSGATGSYMEGVQPYAPFDAGTMVPYQGGFAVYVKLGTGGVTNTGYAIVIPAGNYSGAVMMSASVGAIGDKIGVWLGTGAALVNDFGWIQVYGTGVLQTAASVTANTALLGTATAGQLAASGTHAIGNIFLTTGAGGSAGLTAAELNWPTVTS